MIQYTTPAETMTVEGMDLTGMRVWVSMQKRIGDKPVGEKMHFTPQSVAFDGVNTVITLALTQAQTAAIPVGDLFVQANWISPAGNRMATYKEKARMESNLLDEVVSYGG